MGLKKVLVSDPVAEDGIKILKEVAQVDVKTSLSRAELLSIIGDYDALLVRSGTQVDAEIIAAGNNLKVIGRAGVGVDNIDVEKATEMGILVINAPEGNTISAAEHTMAMMMALSRNVPNACSSLRCGEWKRSKYMGVELYRKKLGIIGFGRIGQEVAVRARAFGMDILAYDPYISSEYMEKQGCRGVTLDQLFAEADLITIHTPKSADTRYMIAADTLARMKDGVRIINVARGGLIDEKALHDAIVSGKVAGAALDVFESEPPGDSPLLKLEQVICTPHLGASTEEAQVKVAVQVAEQFVRLFRGEPVQMAVNAPILPPETMAELKPFIPLMTVMGSFFMQFFGGRVKHVAINYSGEISAQPVAPLTTALLIGLLQVVLKSDVNYINALPTAKQRGIKIEESTSKSVPIYRSLITAKVTTEEGTHIVGGTVFEGKEMRIVQVDDYNIEVIPSRYMVVNRYHDRTGVVGKVGTLLGQNSVNIGSMQVGRNLGRGEAMMVLQVDSSMPPEIIAEMQGDDLMIRSRFIELPLEGMIAGG
ncbi:MAG TPA: phosphoglycerate dehydrogenase [Firmicutes bacterium]|nr:phosphoglycerate dehydrogenase [Bacillota bacterium]